MSIIQEQGVSPKYDLGLSDNPTFNWEIDRGFRINEAPSIFKRYGKYYIIYSGNHTDKDDYACGYMTSGTPLGDYTKNSDKLLAGNPAIGVYGPGAGAPVVSPDDSELWFIYHAIDKRCHKSSPLDEIGVWGHKVCIDRLGFSDDVDVNQARKLFTVGPTKFDVNHGGPEQLPPFPMMVTNKSLFRSTSASATWNPYEPSCAVDARMDTAWASGPVYYSAWLNVELERDGLVDQAINNIEIVWYPAHYATEYKVRAKGTLDSEFYTLTDAQSNECHYTGQTGGYKRIDLPANTRIRNLRIECINANGFEGYVIQELRANQSNSIRVSNQANCSVSASSVFGENSPSNAVLDSENALHWESDHGVANSPESIIIDLGAQKNIDCINIDWGSGYAAAFAIYIDPGGVQPDNFLKIASVSNNASKSTLHELPCPIAARHVKIACTQNGGGAFGYYTVRRIRVYGRTDSFSNYAFGLTPTASSTYQGYEAQNATNDNINLAPWISAFQNGQNYYQTFVLNLPNSTLIHNLALDWQALVAPSEGFWASSYLLEASIDGSNYFPVFQKNSSSYDDARTLVPLRINAKNFRLNMLRAAVEFPAVYGIRSFKLWGPEN